MIRGGSCRRATDTLFVSLSTAKVKMSNDAKKIDKVEPDADVVVLEKKNYLKMINTFQWLLGLSLGLGLALTVTTVKLINTRKR